MTEAGEASAGVPWGRALLGVTGLAVFGAAVLTAGDLATGVVESLRAGLENDYLLVMALGGVAAALSALLLLTSTGSVTVREMPAVEGPMPAPEPGERFDEQVADWRTAVPLVGQGTRREVRSRLRDAAVRTVAAERAIQPDAAERAVAAGEWTDDPVAARFLADGGTDPEAWLPALARGKTPLQYRARRTLVAIADTHDGDRGRSR